LSLREESMAGHLGVNVLKKVREGKNKGRDGESQILQVLLKPTITYGKGKTRRFPSNN
jgi:hypothetical protein